jgi:hypothetical protein
MTVPTRAAGGILAPFRSIASGLKSQHIYIFFSYLSEEIPTLQILENVQPRDENRASQ